MNQRMQLKAIVDSIAKKLTIDFEEATKEIHHRGAKGSVREALIAEEFFRKYIPARIAIARGEIVSTDGQISNECDLVFYDHFNCPPLYEPNGYKVFPVETVYGMMEVKSNLDTKELEDAQKKIAKTKLMPKTAFMAQAGAVQNYTNLYGNEWNYFPTTGFIFAYDSIDLRTLKTKLDELQKGLPIHARVDLVCVLKKGLIVNWDTLKNKIAISPNKSTELRAIQSENPLLLSMVIIQELMLSTWMPNFKIQDYFADVEYGSLLT